MSEIKLKSFRGAKRWLVASLAFILAVVLLSRGLALTRLRTSAASPLAVHHSTALQSKGGEHVAGSFVNSVATPVITVIVPPHRVPADPNIPAAVWGDSPTLGTVPGESYMGRIVVEIFQGASGNQVIYEPASIHEQQFVRRAATALARHGSFPTPPAIWPAVPITGSGGTYLGRAVVELWSSSTRVAVTVQSGAAQTVVEQAVQALGG